MSRLTQGLGAVVLTCALFACETGSNGSTSGSGGGNGGVGGGGSLPVFGHAVIVLEENHNYDQVDTASMPYLMSLVPHGGLATQYYANTHPSIGNYFMLTNGTVASNDDNFAGIITGDNIARALTGAGKSWKAYMESVPGQGYLGGDVYPYARHHNPFAYFSDVLDSSAQAAGIVPLGQLFADMGSGSLPSFALIIPNRLNDAHDCPGNAPVCDDSAKLAAADGWLRAHIAPLMASRAFANGVLIITFDEGLETDLSNGGGQVATVLVGASVKARFQSTTFYQHQSTLRLILDLLKVGDHPGASAGAPSMAEFFR